MITDNENDRQWMITDNGNSNNDYRKWDRQWIITDNGIDNGLLQTIGITNSGLLLTMIMTQ